MLGGGPYDLLGASKKRTEGKLKDVLKSCYLWSMGRAQGSIKTATDRFSRVMGTRRGSDRPYVPPPTLKERLSLDWAANAALEEIQAQIDQGDLSTALEVWKDFSPVELAAFSWSKPGSFEEEVLIAVVERLRDEMEEAWKPREKQIWCFCGYPPDDSSPPSDPILRSDHIAQFRFLYKHELGNAISEACLTDDSEIQKQRFTPELLRQMAADAYLPAVARQMSAIIGRTNGGVSASGPVHRILTRNQTKKLNEDFRFGNAFATVKQQDYMRLLTEMLTSDPRPTPERGLGQQKERRAGFYIGLRQVLEGKKVLPGRLRGGARGPLSQKELAQIDEIASLPTVVTKPMLEAAGISA